MNGPLLMETPLARLTSASDIPAAKDHTPLRTVVIGLGKQSKENHLPALALSSEFELVGFCDIDSATLTAMSRHYNVPGDTSLEQIILDRPFDVALVSVPHHAYLPIIQKLAIAGKHIIKEKPFASSITEALDIVRILQDSKVYLGVTVQRRFNPIYQAFRTLKNQIGKIYSIEGIYAMNIASLGTGWRASKELSGGGALVDMGYHFIDLLIWYFGLPTSVTARLTRGNRLGQEYDVEDTAHLLFDYDDGDQYEEKIVGHFTISRVYPERQERVSVFGTKGIIEVSRGLIRRLDVNGHEIDQLERKGGWPSAAIEQLDFFAGKIRHFAPGVVEDYMEHLQHVALMTAAYESDRTGLCCHPVDFLELLKTPKENIKN